MATDVTDSEPILSPMIRLNLRTCVNVTNISHVSDMDVYMQGNPHPIHVSSTYFKTQELLVDHINQILTQYLERGK